MNCLLLSPRCCAAGQPPAYASRCRFHSSQTTTPIEGSLCSTRPAERDVPAGQVGLDLALGRSARALVVRRNSEVPLSRGVRSDALGSEQLASRRA